MIIKKMPYSGSGLVRSQNYRKNRQLLDNIWTNQDAILIPLWKDRCLLMNGNPNRVRISDLNAHEFSQMNLTMVYLGHEKDEVPVIAMDFSDYEESFVCKILGAEITQDLRRVMGFLPFSEASIFAYARGILHWHRHQKYCGVCGSSTESDQGGSLRKCMNQKCEKLLFPRIEPAVICLIENDTKPRRCLLGRHKGAPEGAFSALAGFVEIGESLEEAVQREVYEEAGVQVHNVIYQASQPWPFPSGLMIGFRATALDESFKVDLDELEEARWFTREELMIKLEQDQIRNRDKKPFND